MLDGPHNFVPLPREKTLFTSPPRTALTLQTPNTYPGKEPFSVKSSDGKAIITNQRVTPSLATSPTTQLILLPAHLPPHHAHPNPWPCTYHSPTTTASTFNPRILLRAHPLPPGYPRYSPILRPQCLGGHPAPRPQRRDPAPGAAPVSEADLQRGRRVRLLHDVRAHQGDAGAGHGYGEGEREAREW